MVELRQVSVGDALALRCSEWFGKGGLARKRTQMGRSGLSALHALEQRGSSAAHRQAAGQMCCASAAHNQTVYVNGYVPAGRATAPAAQTG